MIEFSKKNIAVKTLGERLKDIREKAGISIEEIAKVTKVNKRYLEYIETDNYDDLPSNVYVKGFLRSYSNFLGIEADDVLKIYKKERGLQTNIKKPRAQDKKTKMVKIPTVILPFKLIASLFIGLFFITIGWYFYVETGKFSEAPRLLIAKPINDVIIKESSTEIVGLTDVGNRVIVNGQAIFVNEKGEFRERISLKEGINKLAVKTINKFDKEIQKEITISAQYEKKIPETNNLDEANGENAEVLDNKVRLSIKTRDKIVWISIKVDGINKYSGTMLANTEQDFEGEKEISVTSGVANQIFIKVDNEKEYHELADSAGVVRDVIFKNKASDKKENTNEIIEADEGIESEGVDVVKIENGKDKLTGADNPSLNNKEKENSSIENAGDAKF